MPYELTLHERDPVTILSPPALAALHPLGAAPVIQDDGLLLAESAAIAEYIIIKHGAGRAGPNTLAYLQRIGARPAYLSAMAKSDPDLTPMLT